MKKIWRIRKQLMAACLVAVLVLSMIFVPTKKAYALFGDDARTAEDGGEGGPADDVGASPQG